MHQVILFDDPAIRGHLLPFTFTRPVGDIRVGILKISEKWEKYLQKKVGFFTQEYLREKFPHGQGMALFINGALCPNPAVLAAINNLALGQALWSDSTLLALRMQDPSNFSIEFAREQEAVVYHDNATLIQKSWHIFQFNAAELKKDFELITAGRWSQGVNDPATICYNEENIFVEEGAHIRASVLNAENGPIYIGKNARVEEGALIRGPFALCEGATVNMGGKMRGDTTVGPYSKVGGEISNSVIFGYSNKGHDGFMGNSVIGEWCNFGADSNISNLKNNYASVKLWDYIRGSYVDTGLQFCGLMMGDHSKCGINTMFNTGTVVGVAANIYGAGYPRNFITSFAWGGAMGFSTHNYKKFEETASKVMERRGLRFDEAEGRIYQKVFNLTRAYRIWDKDV
ncbi:MAG TPA: GlmU family protein [Cyclobacteriaceae bacterium]|nr:GlmU family protein [Cyclobacteriaceae bacterium]